MAKDLKNTLFVGDEEYNINAVNARHAESADSVKCALKFEKINLTAAKDAECECEHPIVFDGSADKTITIVPACGGRFTGRITTPTVSKGTIVKDPETILNSADIKTHIVDELIRKSVKCSWNGSELAAEAADASNASIPSICIVTGDNAAANGFASYNNQNYINRNEDGRPPFLSAFIYVSTDDGNNGNIYFGTCDSDTVNGVQVSADHANYAINTSNIVNADNPAQYYDYEKLANIDKVVADNNETLTTHIKNIENGTTVVPKATDAVNAENATTLKASESTPSWTADNLNMLIVKALNIGNNSTIANIKNRTSIEARSAISDSDGNNIAKNYYKINRGTSIVGNINNDYDGARSITISNDTPSGGQNGDIWIKY